MEPWFYVVVAVASAVILVACCLCCFCCCRSPALKSKRSVVPQDIVSQVELGLNSYSDKSKCTGVPQAFVSQESEVESGLDSDDIDGIWPSSSSHDQVRGIVKVTGPLSDINNRQTFINDGIWPSSSNQVRSVLKARGPLSIPSNLQTFINSDVIPRFKGQRSTGYQFAVVFLLSEHEYNNISNLTFDPSDMSGQPPLNDDNSLMPNDLSSCGNYIVARPVNNCNHSEEEIFGKYSNIDSPFSQLWSAYESRRHTSPQYILLYSWNNPCSRCTDVIIRTFGESPYNQAKVVIAHTIFWAWSESDETRARNREKLNDKKIDIQHIRNPERISPAYR